VTTAGRSECEAKELDPSHAPVTGRYNTLSDVDNSLTHAHRLVTTANDRAEIIETWRPRHADEPLADAIGNTASAGASLVEIQLVPPIAFMTRVDGTPIVNTDTHRRPTSECQTQATHRDNSWAASETQAAMTDSAEVSGGRSHSDHGDAGELLHIHQMLRTFADNKHKLKCVALQFIWFRT